MDTSDSDVLNKIIRLKTIVTHVHPDLDACMSSFLLWRAAGRPDVNFTFVPHGKGGDSKIDSGFFVVDTGRGRFDHHQYDSRWRSATEAVHDWLLPTYDADYRWAMKMFVSMANLQDEGKSRELFSPDPFKSSVAEAFSITSVVQGLVYANSDEVAIKGVHKILDVLLDRKLGHAEVRRTVDDKVVWVDPSGKVCLLRDGDVRYTRMVQKKGREIVVYTNRNSFGVTSNKNRIDLSRFRDSSYFTDIAGKEKDRWFVHSDGHVMIHGNPVKSKISPKALAEAAADWLKHQLLE